MTPGHLNFSYQLTGSVKRDRDQWQWSSGRGVCHLQKAIGPNPRPPSRFSGSWEFAAARLVATPDLVISYMGSKCPDQVFCFLHVLGSGQYEPDLLLYLYALHLTGFREKNRKMLALDFYRLFRSTNPRKPNVSERFQIPTDHWYILSSFCWNVGRNKVRSSLVGPGHSEPSAYVCKRRNRERPLVLRWKLRLSERQIYSPAQDSESKWAISVRLQGQRRSVSAIVNKSLKINLGKKTDSWFRMWIKDCTDLLGRF